MCVIFALTVLADEQQTRCGWLTPGHDVNEQTAARRFRRARGPDYSVREAPDAGGRPPVVRQRWCFKAAGLDTWAP